MNEFSVKTANLKSQAHNISNSAAAFDSIADEINNVLRNMPEMGPARDNITSSLNSVHSAVKESERRMKSLGRNLEAIAGLYILAEKNSMQMRGPLGKILQDSINAIAASAAAATAVSRRSNEELMNVSSKMKDRFISDFENEHPDIARKFNRFLSSGENNGLTDDDIRNIKYLAYNAPEPYRSIYLDRLNKLKMGNVNGDGAYYQPWGGGLFEEGMHTVNYTYPDSFEDDPRGAYTTFFHESGHAIDDLSNESKWFGADTENFKTYNSDMGREVTLREAILHDVYYNKNNPHSMTSIADSIKESGALGSKGNTNTVIDALKNGTDPSTLSKNDRLLYNAVVNEFHRTTGTEANAYEGVSDVYGGVSDNVLRTSWGHDNAYWNNENMAGSELWAEFFSYNMAGDTQNLANLREYFPAATSVLDAYANALAD